MLISQSIFTNLQVMEKCCDEKKNTHNLLVNGLKEEKKSLVS